MKSRSQVELDMAMLIAKSMEQNIDELETLWPKSKRGSNAQRTWDQIKAQHAALSKCLDDIRAHQLRYHVDLNNAITAKASQ